MHVHGKTCFPEVATLGFHGPYSTLVSFARRAEDMSWSSEDFMSELEDVAKLVKLSNGSTLHDSLVGALVKKLHNTSNFMPSDFVNCVEAVEKSSLPDEQKKKLSEAVVAKAAAANEEQGNKTVRNPQTLTNMPAYMTKDELNTLMTKDINMAAVTIVQRLRRLGMTSMKEDTKRAAVALEVQAYIWQGLPRPTPDEIYAKAQNLSRLFLNDSTTSPVAPVKVYPSLPTDLGEEWLKKVYDTEPPSLMSLPGFVALQNDCPVRETHRLLSWNQRKKMCTPGRRGQGHGCGNMATDMNMGMSMDRMVGEAVSTWCEAVFWAGNPRLPCPTCRFSRSQPMPWRTWHLPGSSLACHLSTTALPLRQSQGRQLFRVLACRGHRSSQQWKRVTLLGHSRAMRTRTAA